MTYTIAMLREHYPAIKWLEPQKCIYPDKTTYACRVCIANYGLKYASKHQWQTRKSAKKHIQETHL